MHPFAELERNYRELQDVTFRLESLAYSHSSIDHDPVGEPVDLHADDGWVEDRIECLMPMARELRREAGRSFVDTRDYDGDSGEEAEELREYWHSQYFKLGDAIRRIGSQFGEVEYGEEDVDAAATYAEALAEAGGIETDD